MSQILDVRVDAATPARSRRSEGHDARSLPLRLLHPKRRTRAKGIVGGATKRACDFIIAGLGLVALAAPLIAIAIAIRMESKGPSLFLQRRGGLFGRTFLVYKFRTMTSCDDGHMVAQAVKGDARTTRLGAVLRKLSIDELPQLINVLRGDMALVGPRPHAVAHDRKFAATDPRYNRRFRARPGITGLAQISGSRGSLNDAASVKQRVDLDLRYLERCSPLLDLWIVVRTALLVFYDPRAY